jgi:hypothetical protein
MYVYKYNIRHFRTRHIELFVSARNTKTQRENITFFRENVKLIKPLKFL